MPKTVLSLLFMLFMFAIVAQTKDSIVFKNGLDRPSILPTHHFGIFSARVGANFKILPAKTQQLSLNYTSGNNFHPFVEAHFPKDPSVREALSKIIWFNRRFDYVDQSTTPADYMNIVIDAIIKEFRLSYNIPIENENELHIAVRSYLISKGKHPFSLFTSDETIEWFHSNIAGGNDPFGRRYYGINQVNFEYLDRNGNTLRLNANDVFVGGLELHHYYYPNILRNEKRHIYTNLGSHLGLNTSTYNLALDYGISINSIKQIFFRNKNRLSLGVGANILRKNFINFNTDNIDFGTNQHLAAFESQLEYSKHTRQGNYNAIGLNYRIQTRYNKKEEADYYRLLGKWQEINGGWHNGVSTLYNALSDWTIIYTYATHSYKLSLFIKQDLQVNNAPDFQTGINLSIPIHRK